MAERLTKKHKENIKIGMALAFAKRGYKRKFIVCKNCKDSFEVYPYEQKFRFFCSHKCFLQFNKGDNHSFFGKKHNDNTKRIIGLKSKGRRAGEKSHFYGVRRFGKDNPNWKGGIISESYKQRRVFRYKLQKLIFERDNYQCQLCDSGGDLQVDHIASWAEFKELRFDPDNCRTLCAKCHYKITFNREMPENIKGWGHNLLKGRVTT